MKDYRDNREKQNELQVYTPAEVPGPLIRQIDVAPFHQDVHLRDYLNVILKRKWHAIAFLLSVVVLTMTISVVMTPIYKATVVIKIDTKDPNVLSVPGAALGPLGGSNYYQTQYEILKSRVLAETVIQKLHLDKDKDFLMPDNFIDIIKRFTVKPVISLLTKISSFLSSDQSTQQAQKQIGEMKQFKSEVPLYLSWSLMERLDVVPVKDSQLVNVSFTSQKPAIAVNVTNAVADSYIDYDLQSRVGASSQARTFLEEQIGNTKQQIASSERALNDYAAKNAIIFVDAASQNPGQSTATKNFSDLSTSLNAVTTERLQKEALYREVSEPNTQNPLIINNPLIQELKRAHATLEAEYFNLLKTFTPDYPKMKNLKAQMDAISERIDQERANLIKSAKSDYQAALKREENLRRAFDTQQNKVVDFQSRAVQYQILKREVDVNKELLNNLLQRLNEVGVAAMSKASSIQIVDRAVYPTQPYRPNMLLNLVVSIILGFVGGIGLVFVMHYFDTTVKTPDDIERNFRIPSLGMIPFHTELSSEIRQNLIRSDSRNPIAEAFRSIGTFLLLSSSSRPPKIILVTSPGEKEGKTTVCINIASVLAESLGNGIIIDADMRWPKLHHTFGLDNKIGLSSCLSGKYSFDPQDSKLVKQTSVKGISVITSGPVSPNPTELLYSASMRNLLGSLDSMFNFVIIDAPPVMGMPDSVLLSSFADGTVLVVRAGITQREALAETSRIFRSVNTNLLGVVLNGVKSDDLKYGYYSHYFSSYFKQQ